MGSLRWIELSIGNSQIITLGVSGAGDSEAALTTQSGGGGTQGINTPLAPVAPPGTVELPPLAPNNSNSSTITGPNDYSLFAVSPGLADLAARLDAQAAATSALQVQLQAVLEEQRQQQANAAKRQAESSDLMQKLGDTLLAVSQQATAAQQQAAAAQQQTSAAQHAAVAAQKQAALQISSLENTIATQEAAAARREEQRDALFATFVAKFGVLES